jgi:TonB family protein
MSSCGSPLFSSVQAPASRTRWESFAISFTLQTAGVGALLAVSILAPRIAPPALISPVEQVSLELAPPPLAVAAEPVAPRHPPVVRPVAQPIVAQVEAPKISPPPVPELRRLEHVQHRTPVAELARPRMAQAPRFESKVMAELPAPKAEPKIVALNTFGGSSAAPTLEKTSLDKVQTGGFGDPNGVPADEHAKHRSNIAPTGSFDLPQGNGSGGRTGNRGTVASAGFGSGTAPRDEPGKATRQPALQTASSSNAAEAAAAASPKKAARRAPPTVPVSIVSKPTPAYTAEARALKIEGEVLLNVVFTADGKVHVLNVVRGLGHGLDESAQNAARGIRFTPAMRDGKPVNSNATLHVVFQLS